MTFKKDKSNNFEQMEELRLLAAKSTIDKPYGLSSLNKKTYNEKALYIMKPLNVEEQLLPSP